MGKFCNSYYISNIQIKYATSEMLACVVVGLTKQLLQSIAHIDNNVRVVPELVGQSKTKPKACKNCKLMIIFGNSSQYENAFKFKSNTCQPDFKLRHIIASWHHYCNICKSAVLAHSQPVLKTAINGNATREKRASNAYCRN